MNTINEQTATLTKLIAEIVELDSDKQCLSVELDYLIKHLRLYKQTCEECFLCHKQYTIKTEIVGMCDGCEKYHRCGKGDCLCMACEDEEEDSDWDGDLEDTPNCHECGEDCGRTIVSHEKYKNTYFCSQKCQRKYDGEQDNFTNRMCENPECKKEFDLADPHYYDEDQGVCYCCEECSAV